MYIPGKLFYNADNLSHALIPKIGDTSLDNEVQSFIDSIFKYSLPATKERLEKYMYKVACTVQVSGQDRSSFLKRFYPATKLGTVLLCVIVYFC